MPVRSLLSAFAALLLATAASASDKALVIRGSSYYLLSFDAAGTPTVTKLDRVIRLDAPPDDPGDPAPDPTSVRDQVRAWTVAVDDPTTARALAEIYSLVAGKVEDGSLAVDRSFDAIKAATDLVLSRQSGEERWRIWRRNVGDLITQLKQDGELSSPTDHVRVFGEIEAGLRAATAEQGILDKIDFEKLLELIKLIIELIATFS